MVIVKDGIHFLDVLRKIGKIVIALKVVPSLTFADFLPALYGLFRFNDEHCILRNQVNGLQIGFGRQNKDIGQIAQEQCK